MFQSSSATSSPNTDCTARGDDNRWRKLLYIKQDYPDNYVDHTFLEKMQKNVNVRSLDYWTVVWESAVITQHLSSILAFVALFINVYTGRLSVYTLHAVSSCLAVVGYLFWNRVVGITDPAYQRHTYVMTIKEVVLFVAILFSLSPVMKTLTEDTSDDTIYALSVCLFFANLLFHDYGSVNTTNIKFPGSLSLNAAIFASVLLASRLHSNVNVFGLMLFAVEWFALFPMLRRSVKKISSRATVGLTVIIAIATVLLLLRISDVVLVAYVVSVLFITFVCPFWLIRLQRYKNNIRGPWDEARFVLSTADQ